MPSGDPSGDVDLQRGVDVALHRANEAAEVGLIDGLGIDGDERADADVGELLDDVRAAPGNADYGDLGVGELALAGRADGEALAVKTLPVQRR